MVAAAPGLPGPCAANAPLSDGSLGFQRGSAAMLAARAERKQQALLRIQTKQATPTGECVVHAWLWRVCMQHLWPLLGLGRINMARLLTAGNWCLCLQTQWLRAAAGRRSQLMSSRPPATLTAPCWTPTKSRARLTWRQPPTTGCSISLWPISSSARASASISAARTPTSAPPMPPLLASRARLTLMTPHNLPKGDCRYIRP